MRLVRFAVAAACVLVAGVGCDAILGIDDGIPREGGSGEAGLDAGADAAQDAATDAPADALDAGVAFCDTDAAFSTPTLFSTLDSKSQDSHLRLVPGTELVGYFQSVRDGGLGATDIYEATRPSIGDTWTNVTDVKTASSSSADNDPSVSADDLTLYFARNSDLWRATRTSTTTPFGTPVALAAIDSAANDFSPYLVDDGSALYFSSTRQSDAGVAKLFVAQPLADGGFTSPAPVSGTSIAVGDNRFAAVTADQLVLYFASNRSGGQGADDVWVATRASTSLPFDAPRVVPEVSGASDDQPSWVSSDRCRLYFTSNRSGTYELYVATKTP